MANEVKTPIPARLYNAAVGGHVAGADDIIDDKTGMVVSELVGNKSATSEENPFNGMGVVILPMNIQEVEEDDTTVQKNILTQAMMNQANTKYVIKYDYTLGEDITVPANCILEFDGGSISGAYILIGNYTSIKAPLTKIFGLDIDIQGTWKIEGAYPEWFGAVANENVTDNTEAIQKVLDTTGFDHMILRGFRYKVSDIDNDGYCLVMNKFTHISGKGSSLVAYSGSIADVMRINIDWAYGFTEARGLTIQGIGFTNYVGGSCLVINSGFQVPSMSIKDCGFYAPSEGKYCIEIGQSVGFSHSLISNCTFDGECSMYLYDRNIIEKSLFSGHGCALNIDTEYGVINNTIQDNTITNIGGAVTLAGGGTRILNNQIEQPANYVSTHTKSCLIYVKGTSTLKAENIIISNNNLGGGANLTRNIYVEYGFKVVIDNNRIGSCNSEEIYLDTNSMSCIIRPSNFLQIASSGHTRTDQRMIISDNGKKNVGTRRPMLNINTGIGVNSELTFTLHEDNTITLNPPYGTFVLAQGDIMAEFPSDCFPLRGYYTAGNRLGFAQFTINDSRQIEGVAYGGTNWQWNFPVFICENTQL